MEEDQEQNYVTFQEDYVKSHWWARLWMSWAVPFIKHVNKEKQIRDASQCAKMPEGDNSAPTTERMEQVIGDMEKREKEFDYKKNMIWIILKTFKKDMSIVVFWGTLAEITATTNLWFSSFFVRWLQDGGENYEGYLYAIGFVLLFYISQLFRVNYFFSSNYLGINMRKAISCIMYKKALKLSQKSKAISSTGKMITIVSSELQTIEWGIQMAPYLVIAPISTIASFAYIAIDFKEAAAIGFAIFILIIIAQVILSKISLSWKYKESKFSDKRMDVISDGVNGIRTIKTYGWENPFQTLINNFRNKQLKFVGLSHLISSLGFGVFQNGGFLIAIGIFGYHWAMNRELDYSRSLTAITILSYMSQFSIYFLFTAFNCMASLLAILRRTGEVMGMEEYDSEGSKDDHTLQHPIRISIEDASFSWGFKIKKDTSEKSEVDQDSKDINLKSINFTAEEGQLTAIVGAVG